MIRGYFIAWHRRFGMLTIARNTSDPPCILDCFRQELAAYPINFIQECEQIVYVAEDCRMWMLKSSTGAELLFDTSGAPLVGSWEWKPPATS